MPRSPRESRVVNGRSIRSERGSRSLPAASPMAAAATSGSRTPAQPPSSTAALMKQPTSSPPTVIHPLSVCGTPAAARAVSTAETTLGGRRARLTYKVRPSGLASRSDGLRLAAITSASPMPVSAEKEVPKPPVAAMVTTMRSLYSRASSSRTFRQDSPETTATGTTSAITPPGFTFAWAKSKKLEARPAFPSPTRSGRPR